MRTLKRPSHLIYTQRKFFDRITKFHSSKGTFVAPDPVEVPTDTIRNLAEFFCRHRNITVLSGAGLLNQVFRIIEVLLMGVIRKGINQLPMPNLPVLMSFVKDIGHEI
jgi:hypothetical protein